MCWRSKPGSCVMLSNALGRLVPPENLVRVAVTGFVTPCKYTLQGESVQGHMPWRGDNVDSSNAFQVPVGSFPEQVGTRRRKPGPATATRYPATQCQPSHPAPAPVETVAQSRGFSRALTGLSRPCRMRVAASAAFAGGRRSTLAASGQRGYLSTLISFRTSNLRSEKGQVASPL